MNRSSSKSAIILNLKTLGENNSSVTILTPEDGIIYATLYGGPKSRFRSLISPYNTGRIWLYENPEKNQIKISDFEPVNFHLSFSQSLYKTYAAALASELTIKTHCGGSNQQAFTLLQGFLDGMDLCTEDQSRLGLIRYLWRYLQLLGVQPDTSCCGLCGTDFFTSQFAYDKISYYNISDNCFVCSDCLSRQNKTDFGQLNYGAVYYLYGITNLSPKEARNIKIDKNSYEQLKQIVFFLIENNAGCKLNSIETSMGIL